MASKLQLSSPGVKSDIGIKNSLKNSLLKLTMSLHVCNAIPMVIITCIDKFMETLNHHQNNIVGQPCAAVHCVLTKLCGAFLQTLQSCPRSSCPDTLRSWQSCHRWMTTPIPYLRTQTSPQASNPQTTTYQVRLGQTAGCTDGPHHPATSSSHIYLSLSNDEKQFNFS